MQATMPDYIIRMYQERLKNTCSIIASIESHLVSLSEEERVEFKTAVHKLVGTAGYFNDTEISEAGRKLEGSPEIDVNFLEVFKNLLIHSEHYRP